MDQQNNDLKFILIGEKFDNVFGIERECRAINVGNGKLRKITFLRDSDDITTITYSDDEYDEEYCRTMSDNDIFVHVSKIGLILDDIRMNGN